MLRESGRMEEPSSKALMAEFARRLEKMAKWEALNGSDRNLPPLPPVNVDRRLYPSTLSTPKQATTPQPQPPSSAREPLAMWCPMTDKKTEKAVKKTSTRSDAKQVEATRAEETQQKVTKDLSIAHDAWAQSWHLLHLIRFLLNVVNHCYI